MKQQKAVAPPAPEPLPPQVRIVHPLPDGVADQMRGVTWREGCPVALEALALLEVPFNAPDGTVQTGELIVSHAVAPLVAEAFQAALEEGFEITSIQPARDFGGSDDAMMAADNTSAFNCRKTTGGSGFSEHSLGTAIDVNPLRNPYVRSGRILPPEGAQWVDRAHVRPGMLFAESALVRTLLEAGWGWGGQWNSLKDYQHLSRSGR